MKRKAQRLAPTWPERRGRVWSLRLPQLAVTECWMASIPDDTEVPQTLEASKAVVKPRQQMASSEKAEAVGQGALIKSTRSKGVGSGSTLCCPFDWKFSDGLDK